MTATIFTIIWTLMFSSGLVLAVIGAIKNIKDIDSKYEKIQHHNEGDDEMIHIDSINKDDRAPNELGKWYLRYLSNIENGNQHIQFRELYTSDGNVKVVRYNVVNGEERDRKEFLGHTLKSMPGLNSKENLGELGFA